VDRPGERQGAEAPPAFETAAPVVGARVIDPRAPLVAQDIRDTILIKEGELFLLSDLQGNIPVGNRNGLGLYLEDTRVLSGLELVVEGLPPTILLSTDHGPFLSEQVLTNPNLVSADGSRVDEQTIGIRRYRRVQTNTVREALAFDNFNAFPVILHVAFRLEADFADIFEVRGLVGLPPPQVRLEVEEGAVRFLCLGRDGLSRETRLQFDPRPTRREGATLAYDLSLEPRGTRRIFINVELRGGPNARASQAGSSAIRSGAARAPLVALGRRTSIVTSSRQLNAILRRTQEDIAMLASGSSEERFIAAGVPWYATLFGRDSLICALEQIWLAPEVARGTLRLLARLQGRRDDGWRDEEPGKILHELRRGELARLGHVPFDPYYGTIDATPLWVIVLGEYHRVTGDLALVEELRENLEAALGWMDRFGDLDGDGFVEYRRRSGSGLLQQGWKDSWNAIVHRDGTLAEPPIALVEVQGYVYAARRAAARLMRLLGQGTIAIDLERRAAALKAAFDRAFWLEDEQYYCLALDAKKAPVAAITSNPGHALWSGIVPPERAPRVAERLLEEDLFSGWGIRTLSTRSPRFNPSGYHLGTVWPHDNAIAALGLKRYGEEERALMVADALFAAAQHFPGYRLPELFCGFARSAFGVPVRYPVACIPQAWAAAAPCALLEAVLGLQPDATTRELRIVRPRLPEGAAWLKIERLVVGAAEVDLHYQRVGDHTAVDVTAMRGDVRVTFVDRWSD
jgi:glycogen debranching enzyme